MSDTPETDEAQFGTGRVSVDFARRFERERNEARREAERWRDAYEYGMSTQAKSPSKIFLWEKTCNDQDL